MTTNHPIDWDALQCQVDMGRAGTLTPDEARVRIGMVLAAPRVYTENGVSYMKRTTPLRRGKP